MLALSVWWYTGNLKRVELYVHMKSLSEKYEHSVSTILIEQLSSMLYAKILYCQKTGTVSTYWVYVEDIIPTIGKYDENNNFLILVIISSVVFNLDFLDYLGKIVFRSFCKN